MKKDNLVYPGQLLANKSWWETHPRTRAAFKRIWKYGGIPQEIVFESAEVLEKYAEKVEKENVESI